MVDILGWVFLAVGVVGLVVRTVPIGWQPAIVAAAFAPYLCGIAALGVVAFAIVRSWTGLAAAVIVVVAAAAVHVPWLIATSPGAGQSLVVLQANLRLGSADATALTDQVRRGHVDVLTTDELTAGEVARLTAAGLDTVLPYRFVVPRDGGAGTGIWSRYPLTNTQQHNGFRMAQLSATVTVPNAPAFELFAVHLLPPWPFASGTWLREVRLLRDLLNSAATDGRRVIASGDYNSTLDNPQFRRLLGNGFHDAAERAGSAFEATYPADRAFPPLITIDHLVTRGINPASVHTVALPGSDHRGLLARLVIPA
jgi:endonuclease/exonuclease/phosphatase (EEP) superfamily protein YafD